MGGGGGGDEFLLLLLFYLTGESLKTFGYVSLSLVSSHLKWAHNFLSLEQPFFFKVVCIVFMCACIYVWETTFLEFLLVKVMATPHEYDYHRLLFFLFFSSFFSL